MSNESDRERADLLETLEKHRGFLRHTITGMSDEQIRSTPTVSALSLGAIVQHVTEMEVQWGAFIDVGAEAMAGMTPERYAAMWALDAHVTADSLLAAYDAACARNDERVRSVDLDADHALPEAPWFAPGARWSGRRVLVHIIAETSQHAGHADIIRETIDGQKTMG
jgi:uncharacterized damage-inducible protein DinB